MRPASPLGARAGMIVMIAAAILLALVTIVFLDEIWTTLDRLLWVSSGGV